MCHPKGSAGMRETNGCRREALLLQLLRYRPASPDVLCLDHPYECGFVAFEKAV